MHKLDSRAEQAEWACMQLNINLEHFKLRVYGTL